MEADCIREIVLLQERVGIGAVTDGEYPKKSWHEFLFEKCDGFDTERTMPDFKFRLFDGTKFEYPGEPRVIGKAPPSRTIVGGGLFFPKGANAAAHEGQFAHPLNRAFEWGPVARPLRLSGSKDVLRRSCGCNARRDR